ncbi:MAG: ParA family protein [Anaerolineae bacterium]|nr:ParA family protein [Anaerolineae bacterium]
MRKIAIVGFKGGIGKTTTCVNLGAALALRGHRVIIIDTDTQANVSMALGVNKYDKSLTHILTHRATAAECVVKARKNLDILPSDIGLYKAQQRMVLEMAREEIFEELFAELAGYEYQLLDCAPSVSLLTVNTLAYAEEVFIPVSMEMLAVSSIQQFVTYLKDINRMLGRETIIRLIIPTLYDPRRKISQQVVRGLKKMGPVVADPIWVDTKLSEAPGQGKTIFEYAPRSRGAIDYARLTEFVVKMPPLNTNNKTPSSLQN